MRTIRRQPHAAFHAKHPIDAVRRINRRWIVHGGLRESAAAYLDALAVNDAGRLRRSCALAMALVHQAPADEDPKPWFYGGLFALATPSEAEQFLADHVLTKAIWADVNQVAPADVAPEGAVALVGNIAMAIRRSMVPA